MNVWNYDGKDYADINTICEVIARKFPDTRVGFMGDFISVRKLDHEHPGHRGPVVAAFDIMLSTGSIVPSTRKV